MLREPHIDRLTMKINARKFIRWLVNDIAEFTSCYSECMDSISIHANDAFQEMAIQMESHDYYSIAMIHGFSDKEEALSYMREQIKETIYAEIRQWLSNDDKAIDESIALIVETRDAVYSKKKDEVDPWAIRFLLNAESGLFNSLYEAYEISGECAEVEASEACGATRRKSL